MNPFSALLMIIGLFMLIFVIALATAWYAANVWLTKRLQQSINHRYDRNYAYSPWLLGAVAFALELLVIKMFV